jgi:uncharacterized protein
LEKAEYIARKEFVPEKDILLVKIAALYHDVGFINTHVNHEEEGCKIAKQQLLKYGYSTDDIEIICGIIMATKIPQNPKTILQKIVADADLEYLATSKFLSVSELLYQEFKNFNSSLTRDQWRQIQIDFLSKHNYHTRYCRHYKTFRKLRNLNKIKP